MKDQLIEDAIRRYDAELAIQISPTWKGEDVDIDTRPILKQLLSEAYERVPERAKQNVTRGK